MKDAFATDFGATLQKLKWPGKDVTPEGPLEQEWTNGVRRLLELQEPELEARDNAETSARDESLVLLPLEVMVKPLELRFKYHFEGDRQTNKLDKVMTLMLSRNLTALTQAARILSFARRWVIEYL